MTSQEIRQSFLDFFASKQHRIVQSSPVVPYGDPTLLFTNAGMNQFKDVFLATGSREYSRAADTQKCIRVSGKHNDLEEVGRDTYHHTFFEMLGNWSFGDYYKEEAIAWAWELLTDVWKLDPKRLYATVYKTDEEAEEIWKKYLPAERILRFAEKDNFWEMGETGPCGPCSEIHYDNTPDFTGRDLVNAGVADVIEIWNLVFIQYNRMQSGELVPLKHKHVDTGMGFERICAVIQGKSSNYDTDVFSPIIKEIENNSGKIYSTDLENADGIAMRVIADHIRTLSFAIADGATPGNEGRGYVLRRILRRALRFSRNLGINKPFLYTLVPTLLKHFGEIFPELIERQTTIEKIIHGEEESFLQTLERGLDKFENIINTITDKISVLEELISQVENSDNTKFLKNSEIIKNQLTTKQAKVNLLYSDYIKSLDSIKNISPEIKQAVSELPKEISGADSFQLYDTFGFPIDLTELLAREKGLSINISEFNQLMQEQKERSRSARKSISQMNELPVIDAKSEFIGYDALVAEAEVLFVQDNMIVIDKTPFYVESGGQVSDIGTITLAAEKYNVIDVKKSADAIFHICDRDVEPLVGAKAYAQVDANTRYSTVRNHSATHLLHQALFRVLGDHVKQAGSLVAPDYLRFDFNHFEKIPANQLLEIEGIVNRKILECVNIDSTVMSIEEAGKNPNIKMFFGDKYGDIVRVITMDPDFSQELCGGTHARNTSEIGLFKIISESSISAGVRRIEAITGEKVYEYINNLSNIIAEKDTHINELSHSIRKLEKSISALKSEANKGGLADLLKDAKQLNGIRIVSKEVSAEDLDQLRQMAEDIRNLAGSNTIALLASIMDDKAQIACSVTDDLKQKYPAGKLVGTAAKTLGGGGGGKPHLATAGGKDIDKLQELIDNFSDIVNQF